MTRPPRPVFLERESYRRRRLSDAAKCLPVLGTVLLILPVIWAGGGRTASGLIYIFGVWAALILLMAVISRRLPRGEVSELSDASPDAPR